METTDPTINAFLSTHPNQGNSWLGDRLLGWSKGSNAIGLGGGTGSSDEIRKGLLSAQAAAAGKFADQGESGFAANQALQNKSIGALQDLASGAHSVSAEQLRQGLAQTQASQSSMAAGASPQNAAMAARNAAMNAARLGAGEMGQQAMAGLQERNQAQANLSQALGTQGQQNLGAALGSRGNALTGYGAGANGMPSPSFLQQYGPAIVGGLAASDERLKTDVADGDVAASKAMRGLKAFTFAYKDDKYGKGKQLGVMAQGLEKAGLGHAVIDTPEGKMLNGGKLAAAIAAMMPGLDKRLSKLEGGE